jgi:hypothetical protein
MSLLSSDATSTKQAPSEIGALSSRVGTLLRAFGEARGGGRMTAEEVLIFLAIGHLGQTASRNGVFIRPVTCIDIAQMLNIPKETVRRKLVRLVDLALAEAATRGVLIKNQDEWRRLADIIAGSAL